MLTTEQLQAIRERVDNASVGPWEVDRKDEVLDANGDFVVLAIYRYDHNEMNNAEFIAHAPEDVIALLDYADSLIKENERLRGALEWYADIKNYLRQDDGHGGVHYPIDSDKGGRARQALEEK